jgi:hypothetical protein
MPASTEHDSEHGLNKALPDRFAGPSSPIPLVPILKTTARMPRAQLPPLPLQPVPH